MMHSLWRSTRIAAVILTLHGIAYSSDWPMWRNDVRRTGSSAEALADELHLQWTRQLPAPLPAWPNEARLHFDASYEPVVLGSRMFVGSMVDGCSSRWVPPFWEGLAWLPRISSVSARRSGPKGLQ